MRILEEIWKRKDYLMRSNPDTLKDISKD